AGYKAATYPSCQNNGCLANGMRSYKILWADRDGLCLFAKRLERGRFVWPVTREGKVHLTPAQLSMLLEGIAWQHPKRTERPGIRI
ncbi:IS66 family insertion sequence element accessory protein TnpB, partial [Escherichia coli]